MTREIAGVVVLNLSFLVVGLVVAWGALGVQSWNVLARIAGLWYLLGVGLTVLAGTLLLIAGIPFTGLTIVVVMLSAVAACVIVALVRRTRLPTLTRRANPPADRQHPLALGGLAVVFLYLLGLVQLAPRLGVWEPDSWTFWTPKAQAIYRFGELYEPTFTSLPGPTYPLFIPTLQAMGFHAMGSVDPSTGPVFRLQFALLAVGFVAAVAGLLSSRVPLRYIVPVLGLVVVAPDFNYRVLSPLADFPLDYYFALAAIAIVLWIEARQPLMLAAAGLLIAVAMSTKRESLLLAAALLAAALIVTWSDRRFAWVRLIVVWGAGFATTIPWRIWWNTHGLTGEAPASTTEQLARDLDRILPSARLLAGRVLEPDQWLVLVPAALTAAVLLVVTGGPRRAAALYLWTSFFVLLAFTWVFWAVPELPTDPDGESPAPRAMASIAFLSAAFAPLLLAQLAGALRPSAGSSAAVPHEAPIHRVDVGDET